MSAVYDRWALQEYSPPKWAARLHNCPKHRLKLVHVPTPIHKWNIPRTDKYNIYIKRDDLTGVALSGSKIRKMEFLMASALVRKCDHVVTMGGTSSNHCRITAVLSRQLGLQPHLLLRTKDEAEMIGYKGNVLIDRLMGSQIVLCPCDSDEGVDHQNLELFTEEYAESLRSEGANPYVIRMNRIDSVGLWGYIDMFRELIDQRVLENFDDLFVAVASGATVSGLAIANYLTGSKLKIHGVCVCDTAEYFYTNCDIYLQELGLMKASDGKKIKSNEIIDLIDDYKGTSSQSWMQEELDLLLEISTNTGILLDKAYTVKAAKAMLKELRTNPSRFKGKRILFIHTGGIHTLFDGQLEDVVMNSTKTNQVGQLKDFIDLED